MKTILCIDTATDIFSVALKSGENFISITRKHGLKHSEFLMPSIASLYKDLNISRNQTDLIICSAGPGSFTGLRIGLAAAKGLSAGLSAPLVLVPTLDAFAFGIHNPGGITVPVIDAKKNRCYAALYSDGLLYSEYLDISLSDLKKILLKHDKVLLTGPHAPTAVSAMGEHFFLNPLYSAGTSTGLLTLGKTLYEKNGPSSIEAGPIYLRRSEAEIALGNRTDL